MAAALQRSAVAQEVPSTQNVFLMCEGTSALHRVLLTLNNNYAYKEVVGLTLYTLSGQEILLPNVTLAADESRLIGLDNLLERKGIFEPLGYVKVKYNGTLMAVGAQLTLYPLAGEGGLDSARSLSVDFIQARRTTVAWMPPASEAKIAYSNVTDFPIQVKSRLSEQPSLEFTLKPHATRVDAVSTQMLEQESSHPLSHDLTFDGPVDGLRVAGYITPKHGAPLPIRYYDPAMATAANLTAIGLNTLDSSHVAIYNTTMTDYSVVPELRPASDVVSDPVFGPAITIPAQGTAYVNIESLLRGLASASITKATLTIATASPKGALIGSLSEENQEASAIEDIPLRTSNPPAYMRGFYPLRWTSDYVNHPMVTNASSTSKTILAYVIAGGVTYDLPPVTLAPYATHLYDIDSLRSDQIKDVKGVRMPMSANSGKFQWTSRKKIISRDFKDEWKS